ncbi:U7 snRNA-associated Sm-like protein LSm10 isoform X3 [Orussus abietinus]|uniref:U7 snRNA-associated Sm-like protein LSm10 isoform X3 n=1 Tax=Orussus abietinus TaxID=222816 RepID=UPI0006263E04|nr:U7 snRNA-associated Sm-like protein LSm10 isoform X3 [Orussus abietinus]
MALTIRPSTKEKYMFYNSLAILIKALENHETTVDLRNEASVFGRIDQADGFMNIVMKDCIFTDPRGDMFKYDMFCVLARNIRYVHIPPKMKIVPTIKDQLKQLSSHHQRPQHNTFKKKRAEVRQQEGLTAVEQILKVKRE